MGLRCRDREGGKKGKRGLWGWEIEGEMEKGGIYWNDIFCRGVLTGMAIYFVTRREDNIADILDFGKKRLRCNATLASSQFYMYWDPFYTGFDRRWPVA